MSELKIYQRIFTTLPPQIAQVPNSTVCCNKIQDLNPTKLDTILITLQEENKLKSTLQGVAIALLYDSLLRGTEVAMITVKDVSIITVVSQN